MKIEFTVFKAASETRELVGKDGVKSTRNIAHISGFGADDMFDVTVYDPAFVVPNKGQKYRWSCASLNVMVVLQTVFAMAQKLIS